VPGKAFDTDALRIHAVNALHVVQRAACAACPGPQRAPVIGIARPRDSRDR
jgi:hypothetical protein